MVERMATTPFGAARLTARNFVMRAEMERRQQALASGQSGNATGTTDKYQIIRALTEARDVYGLSDRSIGVLEALLSFHQGRELDGKSPVIVFPSNAELSIRSRGMSPATLRRHIAALVETGLIFRRDSPNGKRFCRRNGEGRSQEAFGFDLAPLALCADDIFAHAEAVRECQRRIAIVRSEITLHLRDIAKIIEAAFAEERKGDWWTFAERLRALSGKVHRNGLMDEHAARREALIKLRAEVENAYLESLSEQEMSGNDDNFEHHIHNSNTEPFFEKDGQEKYTGSAAPMPSAPERKSVGIGMKEFLAICPQIADYTRTGVKNWRDVVDAAVLVRTMLGISPSAWEAACKAMGDIQAAIVVAAILERAGDIRSPGGYLRDLTGKAAKGRFSILPMLKALKPQ